MIISNVEQGSEAWFNLRRGRPTASRFKDIITAAKGDLSKSSRRYMRELVAECFVKDYAKWEGNYWTDRGTELEPEALAAFSDKTGHDVKRVGFITRDDGVIGCSPDGLVYAPTEAADLLIGGVEVKCPRTDTHIEYLESPEILPDQYRQQVHGSLAVTGLPCWHFFSYHPGMQPLHVVVNRDSYTEKVSDALDQFLIDYQHYRSLMIPRIQLKEVIA